MIVALNMNVVDEDNRVIVLGSRSMNLTYETIAELTSIFDNADIDVITSDLIDALEVKE